MTKLLPFKNGDKIWIESTQFMRTGPRKVSEYIVVKSNNNSAYAATAEQITKAEKKDAEFYGFLVRIDQRKHIVMNDNAWVSRTVWASKEAFEEDVRLENEREMLLRQAHQKIDELSFLELKEFVMPSEGQI